MRRRITSVDVAQKAGVSQSAVSRVFTPGSSVSERTRAKVLRAARALNYVPNSIARSLITARSNIVAMVIGDLSNPFYNTVLDHFSRVLQEQGKHALVFRVAIGSEVDDTLLSVLQYQVDGIIITSAQVSSKMAGLCIDRGIPVVMFNRYVEGLDTNNVCCDNLQGGRLAAHTLLKAGGSRFGLIAGERNASTNRDRVNGFLAALTEAGVLTDKLVTQPGHYTYNGGYNAITTMFADEETCPDAIFCTNDIMALGAMDALREKCGLRVPADVMILGFDNIPEAARAPYRLTTIAQPLHDMIMKTLDILNIDATEAEKESETHFLQGHLIERTTLFAPPAHDANAATQLP